MKLLIGMIVLGLIAVVYMPTDTAAQGIGATPQTQADRDAAWEFSLAENRDAALELGTYTRDDDDSEIYRYPISPPRAPYTTPQVLRGQCWSGAGFPYTCTVWEGGTCNITFNTPVDPKPVSKDFECGSGYVLTVQAQPGGIWDVVVTDPN